MSSTRPTSGPAATADRVEECADCQQETGHEVRVEVRSENPDSAFSREPYRVTKCTICGTKTTTRLNNA